MIKPREKWTSLGKDDKLLYVILLGVSAFLFIAYVLSAFRSTVNADAGYYLGVTELIHKGYLPYRDFSLGYTPLFFYVLQLPRLLMGTYPDYTGYMFFLYLFTSLDAFLVAVIIKRVTGSIKWAWLSALIFLLLYLYLDGSYFILETFSLCCGLLSLVLLIKIDTSFLRCFFSGACCALAFLSKQYGLLFAGVLGVILLLSDNDWRRKMLDCLSAGAGFCLIIAMFVALFLISGFGLTDLITALSGDDYGTQSLRTYCEGVAKSFRLFPFLLFVPFLLFNKISKDKQLAWSCCAGLLLSSFQFYFNVFPHYFIYMLPFVLILCAMLWRYLRSHFEKGICFLLFFGMLFTACALPLQQVYKNAKALVKHDLRLNQERTAIKLRQTVDDYQLDSALCYWNTIQYYALCPIEPSSKKEYAFAFGRDSESSYVERLVNSDCFIVNKCDLGAIFEMNHLSVLLTEQFHLLEQEYPDGTIVFVKY